MGNVMAAAAPSVPSPPMAPAPPGPTAPTGAPGSPMGGQPPPPPPAPEEKGPGTFEELHKKCKEIFPIPFEGAKLVVNKGLSNHFQVNHTLAMSSLQPSGYKFGVTYVGTKQFTPTEAFPIMIGEIEPSGNLNANIIHQFTEKIRSKLVSQVQNNKFVATQITTDLRGDDYTGTVTLGNIDILNSSGVIVGQYLQNITERVTLGAELLYQFGSGVPGGQIGIYTMAARYKGDMWQLSSNITPMAGGLHSCYYQKVNDNLEVGVEIEGSLRTQECTTTIGYHLDVPTANLSFRGQLDSNYCVGAVMEKKLLPLPFTFALSAFANHAKGAYRFGVGLIVG